MARAVYISKTGNVAKRIHDLNPVKDYFLRERMIMMTITTVSTVPAPAKTKGRMGVLFGKMGCTGVSLGDGVVTTEVAGGKVGCGVSLCVVAGGGTGLVVNVMSAPCPRLKSVPTTARK